MKKIKGFLLKDKQKIENYQGKKQQWNSKKTCKENPNNNNISE